MPNYTLGRGEVHFAAFAPGTQVAGGFRFIGNCPEFTLTREEETLEHYSSTGGIRVKDDEVTLQLDTSGSIVCDDVDPKNIAMFLYGTVATITTSSATGTVNTFNLIEKGLSYQLGVTPSTPTGVRSVASVVVNRVTPAAVLVLGTDYSLDAELGVVTLLASGVTLTNGQNISVTFNVAAGTRLQVAAGQSAVEGALRFVSYNPKGLRFDYYMPWVKLSPNGDLSLIGDEWQSINLNVEALKLGALATVYVDGRPLV